MEAGDTTEKSAFFTRAVLRRWTVPQDGRRRYFIDIWQPGLLLAITTCFTAVFYSVYRDPHTSLTLEDQSRPHDMFFCNADGNVEKTQPNYDPVWDPRLYFTINLAFGQFTFSAVKVLDAPWDVIVGRGGQMLAAITAYRILRRSFTLTLETFAVAIPTVATLYCHQVQLVSLFKLTSEIFWHWSPTGSKRKRTLYMAKMRLGIQVFICLYVLLFASVVSVMTGYRAQLTGYFDEGGKGRDGGLVPLDQLARPTMVVSDASRIGLSDSPLYLREDVVLPQSYDGFDTGRRFSIRTYLIDSGNFSEPYGTLVDYYWTCLGLASWVSITQWSDSKRITNWTLRCARHDCSCTARDVEPSSNPNEDKNSTKDIIFANLASHLTIDSKCWDLDAPPLTIGVRTDIYDGILTDEFLHRDASEYWFSTLGVFLQEEFVYYNYTPQRSRMYLFNNTHLDEDTIKRAGRCVSEDQYRWGFWSLLLLTFCIFTILFASALIVLQTDVYWSSRHDRVFQSHSLYADILYLAGELKTRLPSENGESMPSPKGFGEEVEHSKERLCTETVDLPLSRWEERKTTQAANPALRDLNIPRWRPQGA